ncbi:MAG: dihydrofolate reductase [Rhodobacteraceae bacterium]|nr:dihydrofolate reductase [Paracoccaceae bacterium]TVR48337.1 MAG: dihydrofolate reductase [Paracoccaceae bacterium]
MLTVIVARARNGAIGKDNAIPWHAPEDLAAFQRETLGGAIIMGRRTWESLPRRPLPRRLNIVVTSRVGGVGEGALCTSFENARAEAHARGYMRHYAIGGAGIYKGFLPQADRVLMTEVSLDVPDADTFFPVLPPQDWRVAARHILRSDAPECVLVEYLRA